MRLAFPGKKAEGLKLAWMGATKGEVELAGACWEDGSAGVGSNLSTRLDRAGSLRKDRPVSAEDEPMPTLEEASRSGSKGEEEGNTDAGAWEGAEVQELWKALVEGPKGLK